MRDETWLNAFDHALEAAGVAPVERASARVETEGFLADAGVSAFEHFGPPDVYAAELATVLAGTADVGQRPKTTFQGPVVVKVDVVSKSYRGAVALHEVEFPRFVRQGWLSVQAADAA